MLRFKNMTGNQLFYCVCRVSGQWAVINYIIKQIQQLMLSINIKKVDHSY